ncbi:cytochrome P450 20A1-like [Ptychodera flava]|uniref:cytochrome P450 20A1-like n=1 Tax=Ptychodera flava TaxID=63121 RepID=UPI00396A7D8A
MANATVFVAAAVVAISILYICLKLLLPARYSKESTTKDRHPNTLKMIPGMEKRHPEEGNLQDITDAGGLPQFLFKLHEKYGHVASFWYGKHYYVSLASPEAWKDHLKVFDRPGDLFEFGRALIGDKCVLYANGEDGKRRRKLYDVSFRKEAVANYCKHYQKIADGIAQKLSSVPTGEHIAIKEYMSLFVSRAVGRAIFGDYFDDEKRVIALQKHHETTMDALSLKFANPCLETDEKFNVAINVWHDLLRGLIKHRRDHPKDKDEEGNFLDILMEFCENEEHLFSEVALFYVSGYYTTTSMLVWAFYYMTRDMKIQEKLYEEIISVFGKSTDMKYENLAELQYMKRVLDETIRCSVLPTFAARMNYEKDMKVCDYSIEKGAGVVHALGVVFMDKKIWPNPERFDPDRFLPDQVAKRHKLAFSPFGFAGKRMCPGYRLSYAEGIVLLTTLCRKFKFHLQGNRNIQRKYGVNTMPSEEVWLTIEERQQ